jgi:hypothetical protein
MSPEQALGNTADARSDLYAMGVILYETVTGQRPFEATSLYELLRQQVEADPPPPSTLRQDLPVSLQASIARALAKDPNRRFQSAREFALALETGMPQGSGAENFGLPPAALMAKAQSWSAPSLATAIRAPATPGAIESATPGSYSHNQSIAKTAKSRGSIAAIFAVGCLSAGLLGTLAVALVVYTGRGGLNANAPGDGLSEPAASSKEVTTGSSTSASKDTEAKEIGERVVLEKFNVGAFLPKAVEMAKQHYADAKFVRLDATGLNQRGIIDFTAQSSSNVLYRFRSPSASVPPKDFPENAQFESNCMVYVMVSQNGVMSYIIDKWTCEMEFVALPKCTPEQAWREAERRGAPTGNLVGSVWFSAGPANEGRWHVTIPPSFSAFVPDSC